MGLKQVSFVERSSLSRRVPYRRFHCTFTYCHPFTTHYLTHEKMQACIVLCRWAGLSRRGEPLFVATQSRSSTATGWWLRTWLSNLAVARQWSRDWSTTRGSIESPSWQCLIIFPEWPPSLPFSVYTVTEILTQRLEELNRNSCRKTRVHYYSVLQR